MADNVEIKTNTRIAGRSAAFAVVALLVGLALASAGKSHAAGQQPQAAHSGQFAPVKPPDGYPPVYPQPLPPGRIASAIWCVSRTAGSTGAPCTNTTVDTDLQHAVNSASTSDEIRIASGTYTGTIGSTAVFTTNKSLVVTGGYAGGTSGWVTPGGPTLTVLDGQAARRSVEVQGSVNLTLQNLTINNGGILNNSGTVNVQTGTLNVQNGSINNGAFTVAAGALLLFPSGSVGLDTGTSLGGAGVTRITGAALTITGTLSAQNFDITGGSLSGAGSISAGGLFNWSTGSMSGAGSLTILPGGTLNISGNATKVLSGFTINNNGTTIWVGTGDIQASNSAVFNNGGTFDAQNDQSFYIACCSSTATFNNTGTFRKSVGTATTFMSLPFNNSGTTNVQTGTVSYNSGGVMTTGASFMGPGLTRMTGGISTLTGTVTLQNFEFAGGNLGGNATVVGPLLWTGGTLGVGGTLTVPVGSSLNITGTATKVINAAVVNNAGTLTWWGTGDVQLNTGAVFNNSGLFDIRTDQSFYYGCCAAGTTFVNTGTVRKSAGTATTFISMLFINNGTTDVQTGTLLMNSGVGLSGGSQFTGAGVARISGGTSAITGTVTSPNLEFAGGTITGTGTLVGTFNWTGGTFSGGGTLTIPAGNLLNISGTATKALSAYTLNNAGAANWTGTGDIAANSGAIFNNSGTFDIQNDQSFYYSCCAVPAFNNTGSLRKLAGYRTTTLSTVLNNSGTISVQSGTIVISGGGSSSGAFNVLPGNTLSFGGGTNDLTAASTLSSTGSVLFTGGTTTFNGQLNAASISNLGGTANFSGTSAIDNLSVTGGTANFNGAGTANQVTLASGTIGGTGALTVTGTLAWTGGNLNGTGALNIPSASQLNISGNNDKYIYYMTLNNAGTTNLGGNGNFYAGYSSIFNNSGAFNLQNDLSFSSQCCGSPITFNNLPGGTFTKQAGTDVTNFAGPFNNNGTLNVQSGAISLNNTGTSAGAANVSSGATLSFNGGTHTFTASSSVTGAGTVNLNTTVTITGTFSMGTANMLAGTTNLYGPFTSSNLSITGGTINFNNAGSANSATLTAGTLGGPGTLTVNSAFTWTGGTLSGSNGVGAVTIPAGATLSISGINDKFLYGRTLNNAGSATFGGTGRLYMNNRAALNNSSLLDIQSDVSFLQPCCGDSLPSLNNTGTLRKSAGPGSATLNVAFYNSGTTNVQTGSLLVNNGGGFSAGSAFTGAGATRLTAGTTTITGTLSTQNLELAANGALNGTGILSGNFAWTGGTINGTGTITIPAGSTLNISGNNDKAFNTATLVNAGNATWSGNGILNANNSATLVNSGLLDVRTDTSINTPCCSPALTYTGTGTLRKSQGAGTFTITGPVNNNGLFDIQSGTLTLNSGGTSAGTFSLASGTTLNFNGGTHLFTPSSAVTGSGTVNFNSSNVTLGGPYTASTTGNASGTIVFSNTYSSGVTTVTGGTTTYNGSHSSSTFSLSGGTANFNGASTAGTSSMSGGVFGGTGTFTATNAFNWSAGTINGAGALNIPSGATLSITGNSDKNLSAHVINNAGAATWSGTGRIYANATAFFNNSGTLDLQGDQQLLQPCCGDSGPTLNNTGTLRKTAGTDTANINTVFVNSGTSIVQSGVLVIGDGGTLNNGSSLLGPGVTRLNAATMTLSGTVSAPNLELAAGTLAGTGTLSGTLNWTGGNINSTGTFTIPAGSTLNITGTGDKYIYSATINNAGAVTVSDTGNFYAGYSSIINNSGTFNLQNDLSLSNQCCGSPATFNNLPGGTFSKQVGTDVSTVSGPFNNNGTLNVQSGSLSLNNGGSGAGAAYVSPGATLIFNGGTHTLSAAAIVSGTGTVNTINSTVTLTGTYSMGATNLSGGTTNFYGPFASGTLAVTGGTTNFYNNGAATIVTMSGGTLAGAGTLTANSAFTWTGGTLSGVNGVGAVTVPAGATLTISGNNDRYLYGRTLNNAGNATWTGLGRLYSNNRAAFNNSGILDIQSDVSMLQPCCGDSFPVLNNTGTLRKSGGSGTTSFGVALLNNHRVDVLSGTIDMANGGTSNGNFNVSPGAVLSFSGNTATLNTGTSIGGGGLVRVVGGTVNVGGTIFTQNVELAGGTLSGNGSLSVSGLFNWTGGTMSGLGSTNITSPASLTISGNSNKSLSARTLNNAGAATWSGFGDITASSGAVFNNMGTFDVLNDQNFNNSGTTTISNSGIFRKVGATGTTVVGPIFTNSGTVSSQVGTLSFANTYTQVTGATNLAGGSITASSPMNIQGGNLSGAGTITGSVTNSGQVNPGTSPGVLTITGNYTQAAAGSTNIEIAGSAPGTGYDQLNVLGTANLTGTLNLTVTNGYTPNPGDTFQVVNFATRSGSFATVTGTNLGNGRAFVPAYSTNGLVLSVTGPPATATPTSTITSTPASTSTPTSTPTGTVTPGMIVIGHVVWQGAAAQPDPHQQLPITLTLTVGDTDLEYAATTDANGNFSVNVGNLPLGTYSWHAKGPRYLANTGTIDLSGQLETPLEIGQMRTGDATNDNAVNTADFNILRMTIGTAPDKMEYDGRADFNNDGLVNAQDFNLLRNNFGQAGR